MCDLHFEMFTKDLRRSLLYSLNDLKMSHICLHYCISSGGRCVDGTNLPHILCAWGVLLLQAWWIQRQAHTAFRLSLSISTVPEKSATETGDPGKALGRVAALSDLIITALQCGDEGSYIQTAANALITLHHYDIDDVQSCRLGVLTWWINKKVTI